ncbi:MAG: three-Cys-motif partner protein TcmP [Sedimentisphaerales bacterium]|nr:three-Cys-motif partner protein TcmP [Sedimentisphaerales bacterium]
MATDFHNKSFDESTKLKLEIFRKCFREWLPVFIHDRYTDQVFIFDFFAGSGLDSDGTYGSSLILLEEVKKFCVEAKKKISFLFNENNKKNINELKKNIPNYITNCRKRNLCEKCVYSYEIKEADFKQVFFARETQGILENKNFGKFILLDQYGFKEINNDIFLNLIGSPKTDFIFFISSSFIKRFQQHEYTKKYIDIEKLNFNESQPKECHRIIAKYFKSMIPKDQEYYLHHFTIQKENKGNYYGLIFGTNHTLGMEKFLKVCWKIDPLSGESNCNIDDDFTADTLFYNESHSHKKKEISKKIEKEIIKGNITNNIDGFKFTIYNGCEPSLFTKLVKKLEENKQIIRLGNINNNSTNVHRAKKYTIKVLKNENE